MMLFNWSPPYGTQIIFSIFNSTLGMKRLSIPQTRTGARYAYQNYKKQKLNSLVNNLSQNTIYARKSFIMHPLMSER